MQLQATEVQHETEPIEAVLLAMGWEDDWTVYSKRILGHRMKEADGSPWTFASLFGGILQGEKRGKEVLKRGDKIRCVPLPLDLNPPSRNIHHASFLIHPMTSPLHCRCAGCKMHGREKAASSPASLR